MHSIIWNDEMEDAFDLFDAIELLSSLSDADTLEHGGLDALSQLLDAADYVPYGSSNVELLGMLDPENQNFWSAGIDLLDSGSDQFLSSALEGIDVDAMDLSSILTDENLALVGESVFANGYELPGLIESQLSHVHESIMSAAFSEGAGYSYFPYKMTEIDAAGQMVPILGEYNPLTNQLNIFDSPEQALSTYYHEIGHHVALDSHPGMFNQFTSLLGGNFNLLPEGVQHFIESYPHSEWMHEAFAESFNMFFTNPHRLADEGREIYDLMNRWYQWGAAQSFPLAS